MQAASMSRIWNLGAHSKRSCQCQCTRQPCMHCIMNSKETHCSWVQYRHLCWEHRSTGGLAQEYVCMYAGLHSRIHKDIDTSDNRDRRVIECFQ